MRAIIIIILSTSLVDCRISPRYSHNLNTYASHPGSLTLSNGKLKFFRPDLSKPGARQYPDAFLDEHLRLGDSRAAIVVEDAPDIIVAAYSDELDCVVLLRFPPGILGSQRLRSGDRLLTVNTYSSGRAYADDLVPGPAALGRWKNFFPLIADFLTDDLEILERKKREIPEAEWILTARLAATRLTQANPPIRNGSPYFSALPVQSP